MYMFAAICFVLSFLSIAMYVPLVSIVFFSIGTLLTGICLARRFWTQTRIHLLELLLMTIIAGGVIGFSLQMLLPKTRNDEDAVIVIVVLFCTVTLWIMGAVSNAIIIAERLKIDTAFGRLWLIGVYLLLPIVVLAMPILLIASCAWIVNPIVACLAFCMSAILPVIFFCYAWGLRRKAKRALVRPVSGINVRA